ncbi:hypothetical protein Tco_0668789 [Tanacetum coccineum]
MRIIGLLFEMISTVFLLYSYEYVFNHIFDAEPRNVRLGLAADGFNPFGNLSQSYSIWPVILTTYNLPPWLCMKESSFMLTLLIPGPKSLGKDIDVYLRPLIDDLKDLWAKPGVETIDVATGLKFNMRAMVLWTINDFPARSSLSGWSGQGYRVCPTYNEDTPSVCVLGKTAYVGHRRFLKKPHKLRRSLEFNGETQNGDPLREFNQDAIMTQLARLPTRVKARQDLKRLGIQSGLWLGQNKNGKCSKPQAAYSFKPEDKKSFVSLSKELNYQMGSDPTCIDSTKSQINETNITGLKSHDCHIMMQRLLPYELQQYLPPDVAKPLIKLCLFFKQICSQTLMVDDMLKAQSKPKGSIAKGYVAEEALTFSSHYFWDVTTKFNRPDRNVDFPPPTCQFQVFKSLCKSISLRSVIRIDHQELKKVIWYVLHNSPEIDTYRAKFKSEFPNNDMKEAFPGYSLSDPIFFIGVSESSELFALACGPSQTPISVNSCVVNGVRNNITQIKANGEAFKNDQYILATQVKQCFYLEDMARRPLGWKVVEHVSHKKFLNGGVIVVEDDPDVIHVDNSSDLALSTSLNDLEIAALHIDGQSIDVDAPPDIIDVVDEDDDIIDKEDPIPHDLADSDDEDLGVNVMSADVARGHGGDGGGDDRPPPYQVPTGCGGCLGNRGKGTRKPNLGGRRAGRPHTRQETRNLGLKAITDKSGPVPIRFEVNDRETLMPLGDHAAHWANYLGELVRELPLHYPSWRQMSPERKAGVVAKIGHLQKIYNGKKAALKERHWIPDSDGTYDLERIRLSRPSHISEMESSATREYPSLIHTFFLTHTVNGVFLNPEDKALYMSDAEALQGPASNTETVGTVIVHLPPPCTHITLTSLKHKRERSAKPRQRDRLVAAGVAGRDDQQGYDVIRAQRRWEDEINADGFAKDWDVDKLADQAGFELVESAPFEQKDFPVYHSKQGYGKTPDGPFRLNDARTLVYKLLKTDD